MVYKEGSRGRQPDISHQDRELREMSPRKHVEVTIVGARGLKRVAWIGVNQPVAVAWVSPRAARSTQVAVNGGSNPVWNQRLLVPVNDDLQPSVSWDLKVQVSHHMGFLCCLHRPIGTAIIPVADILNASNDGTSSSPQPHTQHLLPILTYPLLGAFNRQHGFLDVTLRLLKVLPHSHAPFLPPSPSHSSSPISISPPPHSSPSSSQPPSTPSSPSPSPSSSDHVYHQQDHEIPAHSSLAHSSSSLMSSSSEHSFHEADLPLSPPLSPHSTLKHPSTTTISPPFTIPPSNSPAILKLPSPASLPITTPIPTSLISGPFPTKPFPPPTQKASLPMPIPIPPHTAAKTSTILLPAPKKPTTLPTHIPPPPPPSAQNASLPIPIPPPHITTAKPTAPIEASRPIPPHFPISTSKLPTLTVPPSITSPIELADDPNPKSRHSTPLSTLALPISPPKKTILDIPITNPTQPDPLRPSSTLPYLPPPPPPPPLRINPSPTLPTIPTTPQLTLIHISTTTILPIPSPPSPTASPPSPSAKFGDKGKHIIHGSCEGSSITKSKNDGTHEEVSHDDGNANVAGATPLPVSKFKNEGNLNRCDAESETSQQSWKDHNDSFIPSPYDDPFFDLEHLYPQPDYSGSLYMESTHLYPCEEEVEASYHYPFEPYKISKE